MVINTPRTVRQMAAAIRAAGVKPELEVFDSGDIHLARDLMADGTLEGPGLWTLVLGVKYGFSPSPQTASGASRRNSASRAQTWLAKRGRCRDRRSAFRIRHSFSRAPTVSRCAATDHTTAVRATRCYPDIFP